MAGLIAFSEELAQLVQLAAPAVVGIDGGGRSTVSGFHWEEGYLLTAEHGIRTDDRVPLVLPDRTLAFARVVGRDPAIDLALLHTADARLASLPAADPATLLPGHILVTVGRGRDSGVSAALGILASRGGPWRTWRGGAVAHRLRLDATLPPGLLGAPVMTAGGAWAGLATAALSRSGLVVVDPATLLHSAAQLRQHGRVPKGYLGVGLQPVALPESLGLAQRGGVIVLSVEAGSAAARAGLLVGDILIGLGTAAIADVADLQGALRAEPLGTPVAATLLRGGQLHRAEIILGDRP